MKFAKFFRRTLFKILRSIINIFIYMAKWNLGILELEGGQIFQKIGRRGKNEMRIWKMREMDLMFGN